MGPTERGGPQCGPNGTTAAFLGTPAERTPTGRVGCPSAERPVEPPLDASKGLHHAGSRARAGSRAHAGSRARADSRAGSRARADSRARASSRARAGFRARTGSRSRAAATGASGLAPANTVRSGQRSGGRDA